MPLKCDTYTSLMELKLINVWSSNDLLYFLSVYQDPEKVPGPVAFQPFQRSMSTDDELSEVK